jgi:hypothetical protein
MQKSTWPFMVTTLIAMAVAIYFWQQLVSDRQVIAQLRDRVAQLELAQVRKTTGIGQQKESTLAPTPISSAEALRRSMAMPNADRAVVVNTMAKQADELRKDPAVREAMLAQLRARLPSEYPDLGKALGLTYEQLDALLDLLASQQMNPPLTPAELEGPIEAQLGPEKFQKFLEYRRTKASRLQVDELRTALSPTAHPLTDQQQETLLDRMSAEQKLRAEEIRSKRTALGGPGVPLAPNESLGLNELVLKSTEEGNQRVLEEAGNYLKPEQVAALRSMLEQQLSVSRASLRLQKERLQGGAR